MNIYDELGLRTLVNCAGTYTIIGGSKMSSGTTSIMAEAAQSHVEIRAMLSAVNSRIAEMTQNEDACITSGAMAGIYLTIASCISMKYEKEFRYISKETVRESEVIMFRAHRNPYDQALELLGVKLIESGYPNNIAVRTTTDLEHLITDKTAAVFYLDSAPGGWLAPGALDLDSTIKIAESKGIPVIVDAAAQLPPVSNLWNYTKRGAAAALFSGGKDLRGPQSTGLVLGKNVLLKWLHLNNFPNYGIGRIYKVGREEIAGLYNAVKEYVQADEDSRIAWCEEVVGMFADAFSDSSILSMTRAYPNEAGQPVPRARIDILSADLNAEKLREQLLSLERAVFTMIENGHLYINPVMMDQEEAEYVLKELKEIEGSYS